jgi:1-phosphofructokinase
MNRAARVRVVALNPSVDVEWRTGVLRSEEKNELLSENRWPGGKGVNVTRWLNWAGVAARLFLPLGGATGKELYKGLRAEGLRFDSFSISADNRANYLVTPSCGPQFRFNATWPRLSVRESTHLRDAANEAASGSDWAIFSGALPFGAPKATYAWLVRRAVGRGQKVVLDCDGEAFALAVRERPTLVKPNEFELAQWAGCDLRSDTEIQEAALRLAESTHGWVLVTRGAERALLVHACERQAWIATPPTLTPRNTVGAGDATVAGAIAGIMKEDAPPDWLQRAIGTGTAATQVPPGKLPSARAAAKITASVVVQPFLEIFR